MKLSRTDFLKTITGGAAATRLLGKEHQEQRLQEVARSLPGHNFDVIDSVLYDSLRLVKGLHVPAQVRLFCEPVGMKSHYTGRTKYFDDTNMFQCGQLDAPRSFLIRHIGFIVSPFAFQTESRFLSALDGAAWEYRFMDKIYARGPLALDTTWGKVSAGRRRSRNDKFLGDGVKIVHDDAQREVAELGGLFIPSMACFGVYVTFRDGFDVETDFDFWVTFSGLESRAIQ